MNKFRKPFFEKMRQVSITINICRHDGMNQLMCQKAIKPILRSRLHPILTGGIKIVAQIYRDINRTSCAVNASCRIPQRGIKLIGKIKIDSIHQ